MFTNNNNYTYPQSLNAKRTIVPYAWVRFCNERLTLKACLESLLPFFDRGIICYHDPLPGIEEDGSVEIAKEFVRNNPGFKLIKYPFPVIYQDCDLFYNGFEQGILYRAWLLDTFSNFAFEHAKSLAYGNKDFNNAFLFKVDADHIYNLKNLENLYQYAIEHDQYNSFLSYQFNVGRARNDKNHINFWRFFNTFDHFFTKLDHICNFTFVQVKDPNFKPDGPFFKPFKQGVFGGFERVVYLEGIKHCFEQFFINSIHFNREKLIHSNNLSEQELDFIYAESRPLSEVNLIELAQETPDLLIDPDFYSEPNILKIINSFDYNYLVTSDGKSKHFGQQFFDQQEFLSNPKYIPNNIIAEFNTLNSKIEAGEIQISEQEQIDRQIDAQIISKILDPNYQYEILMREDFNS